MRTTSLFIYLVGLCWPAFTWAAPALDLSQTVLTRSVISAKMSPDGEQVAYLVRRPWQGKEKNGKTDPYKSHLFTELFVVDEQGRNRPYVSGNVNVVQPAWNFSGEYLYFLLGENERPYAHLYRIPLEGGQTQLVYRHSNQIKGFALHPGENKLLFWAKDGEENHHGIRQYGQTTPNRLWTLDLEQLSKGPVLVPLQEHVQEASFHPRKDQLLVKVAPSADKDDEMTSSELLLSTLQGQIIRRYRHKGKMESGEFSPDGNHIAFIGSVDQHSPAAARLYVSPTDSESPEMLLSPKLGQVSEFAWLKDSRIAFLMQQGTESVLGSKTIGGNPGRFSTLADDGPVFSKLSVSDNGRDIALIAHSQSHPPELYWHRSRKLRRITINNAFESGERTLRQSVERFASSDGTMLEGVMVKPQGKPPAQGWPLVILVHGGPATHIANGWLSRYSYPAYAIADAGYLVIFPNYRGSTGKGEDFLRANQADFAGAEFDDILATKQYLVDEGLADPNRVAVAGSSYGGYAAAWAATAHSDEYQAAISLAGISNQVSKFGTTDIPRNMMLVHAGEGPWQSWQKWLERSPVYHTPKSMTPLLLAHGELDKRVPLGQAVELYRHLKLVGQAPVELIVYDAEGHGLVLPYNQLDFAKRMMEWLDQHLAVQSESASSR